jgi:hypothetical protein
LANKILDNYFDDLDKIREDIDKQSESILELINPEKLLNNPAEYLSQVGRMFFEHNRKNMKKAIKLGQKKSRRVLNEIEKG